MPSDAYDKKLEADIIRRFKRWKADHPESEDSSNDE
jgi:hypothetical protein